MGAILVNVLLTIAQVVGGLVSGSLSLVADALHNLSDAAALGVAFVARRIARRPADEKRTFGYQRAEIIGALINLTALVVVGLYLLFAAVQRVLAPEPVEGWIVVWVAALALVVDAATAALTYRLSKGNINVRAAFVHNVSDALGSVAVIVSGTLILRFGWYWTDAVAALSIAAYVLYQGVVHMRFAIRILMEGAPADVALDALAAALTDLPGIVDVHHVHVWQLDELHRALEAHVVLDAAGAADSRAVKAAARRVLAVEFRIGHSTLELELPDESGDCRDGSPGPCPD